MVGEFFRPLERTVRLGLVLSCLIIATLTPQFAATLVPNAGEVATQTAQSPYTWRDMLSGGVWARLNNLESNHTILDSAQANAMFGSPPPGASPSQLSTSKFTNNFRVTGNSSLFPLEDEPSIAVTNQTGHFLMVVGANSLSTGQMAAYASRDQGTHWTGPTLLSLSRANDSFASDPALGVDRSGTFYYAFLSIGSSLLGSSGGQDDVVVATSQDGGNWANHVAVQRRPFSSASSNFGSEVFDKEYIAVGPSKSNPFADAVYITYTDFVDFCSGIVFVCHENSTIMQVHSTDGGVTWSESVSVSPTATTTVSGTSLIGRLVQGSMPAVAPDGNLYVAYYDSGTNGWLNASASVMITKSTDSGKTFSPPTQAALIPQQLTFKSEGISLGFRWWTSMFPSMDVAPDGTVYIAYGARQSKLSLDPADVYLVASTDGGVIWTQPRKINDDSTQNGQFFAWLKVSSDGVVHIIWGDQRLDPVGLGYDVFYAEATNHGTTITSNSRVTDVGTDPLVTIGFVGDYFNMAVSGNQVYPVWTDGRRGIMSFGREFLLGETDIFVARLGPRDTPNITIRSSTPAGYTAPTTIYGSGLPREAFFVMRMNGVALLSQKNGIIFFFSTKESTLSDIIIPNSNYYGTYSVELDEWLSGARLATTTLYVVDTRNLQVLVGGPSIAFPGENVTWNLQVVLPSGSLDQPGFGSTLSLTEALLTSPSGLVQNLTSSVRPTGSTSYTLSTTLPTDAAAGSYSLFVSASQTGSIVQRSGIGTATLIISHDLPDFSVIASPTSISTSADSTGTSTITVISVNHFTGTVSLTQSIFPTTGLDCSLSTSSITLGVSASSILSCTGSARTYTVTITGTTGHASHSTTVSITVNSASSTIFGVSPLLFYGGAGGILAAIVIAMVGTLLALRQRKHEQKTGKRETPSQTYSP